MKKVLIPFLLSLSLFLAGCSSIYQNHHRTTKLIINLPNVTRADSRNIYTDDQLGVLEEPDVYLSKATFYITISSRSETFEEEVSGTENSITFSDLAPGNWTITGSVSIPGLPDFAFGDSKITIKAGDIKNIPLTLEKNTVSKISDIDIEEYSIKTEYELGESLDVSNARYIVTLSNGYSITQSAKQLSNLGVEIASGFVKHSADTGEPIPIEKPTIQQAQSYCFSIMHMFKKDASDAFPQITKTTDILLYPKKPVITKQPSSTKYYSTNDESMDYGRKAGGFSFSVTVDFSTDYYKDEDIEYHWYSKNNYGSSTNIKGNGETLDSSVTSATYSDTYTATKSASIAYDNSMDYIYCYCIITNTNTTGTNYNPDLDRDSIRKNQTKTIDAVLELWGKGSAGNQHYKTESSALKYNGTFINHFDSAIPVISNLYVVLKKMPYANDTSESSKVNVSYYDYETFNITDFKLSSYTTDKGPYLFGFVGYTANYSYPEYTVTAYNNDNGTSYGSSSINPEIKNVENQSVRVQTLLAKIPDLPFSLSDNSSHTIRYYSNEEWYDDDNEKIEDQPTKVIATPVLYKGYYCNETSDFPTATSIVNCSFKVYKSINNGIPEINEFYPQVSGDSYNDISYQLSEEDLTTITNGNSLTVWIECTKTVPENLTRWFDDKSSVTQVTDKVVFSKKE